MARVGFRALFFRGTGLRPVSARGFWWWLAFGLDSREAFFVSANHILSPVSCIEASTFALLDITYTPP